jgi:hypothetical protein
MNGSSQMMNAIAPLLLTMLGVIAIGAWVMVIQPMLKEYKRCQEKGINTDSLFAAIAIFASGIYGPIIGFSIMIVCRL